MHVIKNKKTRFHQIESFRGIYDLKEVHRSLPNDILINKHETPFPLEHI